MCLYRWTTESCTLCCTARITALDLVGVSLLVMRCPFWHHVCLSRKTSCDLSLTITCTVHPVPPQGFPDRFCFSGNVHNRHRQIGNAVPPPLARALATQLRKTLEAQRQKVVMEALAAQMGKGKAAKKQ